MVWSRKSQFFSCIICTVLLCLGLIGGGITMIIESPKSTLFNGTQTTTQNDDFNDILFSLGIMMIMSGAIGLSMTLCFWPLHAAHCFGFTEESPCQK